MQFLAQYVERESYEFKQRVYGVGEEAGYWYGIVRGEFVFSRRVKEEEGEKGRGKEKEKERGEYSRYFSNRVRNVNVGIVEAGQSFGEQEVLEKCPRKVSVICMSNDNEVIKIPGQYFEMVYREYPRKSIELARSLEIRDSWKAKFSSKIQETMKNYGNLIKKIGKS